MHMLRFTKWEDWSLTITKGVLYTQTPIKVNKTQLLNYCLSLKTTDLIMGLKWSIYSKRMTVPKWEIKLTSLPKQNFWRPLGTTLIGHNKNNVTHRFATLIVIQHDPETQQWVWNTALCSTGKTTTQMFAIYTVYALCVKLGTCQVQWRLRWVQGLLSFMVIKGSVLNSSWNETSRRGRWECGRPP